MRRSAYLIAGLLASITILLSFIYIRPLMGPAETARTDTAPTTPRPSGGASAEAEPAATTVSLYCQFYVFVESRPFVAFLFDKADDERPVYDQVYVAKADGDRTDYNAATGGQPEWRFDAKAEPPRLSARIAVPNTSQAGIGEEDIAIEVYGFDGTRTGNVWYEASLKSVYYQNLPGKCRQT